MAPKTNQRTTFPSEVARKSNDTIAELEGQGFFSSHFENTEDAKTLFFNRLSESLLSKFINGDDMEWEEEEYDRVMTHASVEQAVDELEKEGKVHRFDEIVVLAGS